MYYFIIPLPSDLQQDVGAGGFVLLSALSESSSYRRYVRLIQQEFVLVL